MNATTATTTPSDATGSQGAAGLLAVLRPLAIDIALPLGVYYVVGAALGAPPVWALAAASAASGARALWSTVRDRRMNGVAVLMLGLTLAGLVLTFVTGNARLMIAKDSAISSVAGLVMIWSVLRGRPLMTSALEPYLTKGNPERLRAWQHLTGDSTAFAGYLVRYTMIWAAALLVECSLRIVGAFLLPVDVMVWLSTVLVVLAIGVSIVFGGAVTVPMERLIEQQVEAHRAAAAAPLATTELGVHGR